MSTAPYYVLKSGPWAKPATLTLARQRPYAEFSDAVADMGSGVVFDSQGDIVAFHETHARLVEHLDATVGRVGDNMGGE